MNEKVKKAVSILGWILFIIIYSGIIVGVLWYIFDEKDGAAVWMTLSFFSQLSIILLGAGALVVYTIVMFFAEMALEAMWITIVRRILKTKLDIKKMREEMEKDV